MMVGIIEFYRCMIMKDTKVVAVVLRRGYFLSRKQYLALLKKWSGKDENGCYFYFYETADPGCMSIPALQNFEETCPELA